jgi:hypothetical protein
MAAGMGLHLPACSGKPGAGTSSAVRLVLIRCNRQRSSGQISHLRCRPVRRQHAVPVRALGPVAMPVVTEVAKRALAVSASGSFASNSAAQREWHDSLQGS